MEEVKIIELPEKESIKTSDYLIIEDEDGTKKVLLRHFRSIVLASMYFDNIQALKTATVGLKEGDICQTLGYYEPGDGGAAYYRITYNPGAVEDGKFIHYLSFSDTLRAELIIKDTINVHQFGAKGDGRTDDTAAIQSAIDNSLERTVEFTHGKKYAIKNSIAIHDSNIIINGNGAELFPQYVNGIDITPLEDTSDPVTGITINNLNFDCSRANLAIYANRATNININKCDISNITSRGIDLKNSVFVNIGNCEFNGNNAGSSIILEGNAGITSPGLSSRAININNCRFSGFSKAVHVLSTGNNAEGLNTLINLTNCSYYTTVIGSYCIYIASPMEMMNIVSNTVEAVNTFLCFGGASKGEISCRGLSCFGTAKIFDIGSAQGIVHLDGPINVSSTAVLFENMMGKLHTNVMWDLLPNGASFNKTPIGEIFDVIQPHHYAETKGYSISASKLTIREARNLNVNWSSSTNNLNEIVGGVKGQLLYIKSSTNKSILSVTNKIVMSSSSITLGAYNGILLKYDGLKWVQMSTGIGSVTTIQNIESDSTYDIWLKLGNTGTPQDFLDSIKGTGVANIASENVGDNDLKFTFEMDDGTVKDVLVVSSGSI